MMLKDLQHSPEKKKNMMGQVCESFHYENTSIQIY